LAKLIWKEWKESKITFLVGLAFLVVLALILPYTFELIQKLLKEAPEMTGLPQAYQMALIDYDYFVWSQWFPKNLIQIGIVVAIILGATAIASEVGATFEFLFTKPVSKGKIFFSKVLTRGGLIFLIAVLSTATLFLVAWLKEPTFIKHLNGLLLSALATFTLIFLGFAAALFFSTLTGRSIVAGLLAFLTIVALPLGESLLKEEWRWLGPLLKPQIFMKSEMPWAKWLINLGLAVLIIFLTFELFKRRELG
jgi:ABC-type transport system involved in multi-copper enzyme maturation permease subunit